MEQFIIAILWICQQEVQFILYEIYFILEVQFILYNILPWIVFQDWKKIFAFNRGFNFQIIIICSWFGGSKMAVSPK